MANLKKKVNTAPKDEDTNLIEEAVNSPISLADEEEVQEVFEMLAGYKDKDGTIHREFTLREMTGKDEEAIGKSDIRNNSSKVASILLTRCVTSIGTLTMKSVGGKSAWSDIIKNLYVGDQDYMLLQLRKISIGSEIEVAHTCVNSKCKAKLKTVLEVDELNLIEFSGEREIPFELPSGYRDKKNVVHKNGIMRLPTGIDREVLTPLAKTNLAKANTTMLTRLCKFDDGVHVDDDVMGNLVIRDREYLQELLRDHSFGIELEMEVMCDICGETFTGLLNLVNFI